MSIEINLIVVNRQMAIRNDLCCWTE